MALSAGAVTFAGSATDVWVIQVDNTLTVASGTQVVLSGGALSSNIFWAVSAAVYLEKSSHFEGILNTNTGVVMNTLASMNGRIFAGTAVTLKQNTVVQPAN
jgi:hypothetical protein